MQNALNNDKAIHEFVSAHGLSRLCDAICSQLKIPSLNESIAELSVKNLVGLTNHFKLDEEFEEVCRKLVGICKNEIAHHPKDAIRVVLILNAIIF